jgi:hypothetical protein
MGAGSMIATVAIATVVVAIALAALDAHVIRR